jgi:transcriptional regulator with GAF, ATPase, and Fis domain
MALDWLPLVGAGKMSDHSDALSVRTTDSRAFVSDTVAQVFSSEADCCVMVGESSLEETLGRLADLANDTISASDMVSMTMLVDGRPLTAAFTDVTASEIDNAQYHSGLGPGLDAMRYQHGQRVNSADTDERWPPFAEAAAAHGILSSLSLPLVVGDATIGAINCYSRRPIAFSADDERIGSAFATPAAVAVTNAQAYWDARHRNERLSLAFQSRATIEQAKGIVMAVQHCDADQAFEMLVRASQHQNRKLRDIADRIVQTQCCQPIDTIRDQSRAWLTERTTSDQRRATVSRSPGSAPDIRSGPTHLRGLHVGLPARRTAPPGPLRSG